MDHKFSLFDAPLVYNFGEISTSVSADLRKVFDDTLVQKAPVCAVACSPFLFFTLRLCSLFLSYLCILTSSDLPCVISTTSLYTSSSTLLLCPTLPNLPTFLILPNKTQHPLTAPCNRHSFKITTPNRSKLSTSP